MAFRDDPQGAPAPPDDPSSYLVQPPSDAWHNRHLGEPDLSLTEPDLPSDLASDLPDTPGETKPLEIQPEEYQVLTDPYPPVPPLPSAGGGGKPPRPPKPPDPPDPDDAEESGMARMSFLEHLEELRKRLLLAIGGVGVAFFACLFFSDELWDVVLQPAGKALTALHVNPPT